MRWLLFLAYLFTCISAEMLEKRQAVPSTQCAQRDNTWAICSPAANDTWYNGTFREFIWKYDNSVFTSYDTLILYLLQVVSDGYTPVKTWANVSRTPGVLVEQVDDSWFPTPLANNSPNRTWTMAAYIVPPNVDIQSEFQKIPTQQNRFPAPIQFYLIQNAYNTSQSSQPSATTASTLGRTTQNNSFPPWLIAVICIVGLLGLGAAAGLIWFVRRRARRAPARTALPARGINKNGAGAMVAKQAENSSIHSSTPMMQVTPSPSTSHRNIAEEPHPSLLSSADAVMIGDQFRQAMRNPVVNADGVSVPSDNGSG